MMPTVKGIIALFGWFVLALAVSTFCVTISTGVSWYYYPATLLVPFGAFRAAKTIERTSVIVCYGLVAGFVLALPVFTNSNTGLSLAYGGETISGLLAKILAFAGGLAALCFCGHALGLTYWEGECRTGQRQPAWPVVPRDADVGNEAEKTGPALPPEVGK